jgi:hypothetical protein
MAWSWSHTGEAYENVKANIEAKPREWLEVVWAEWVAAIPHPRFGIDFHADLDTHGHRDRDAHEVLIKSEETLQSNARTREVQPARRMNGPQTHRD